MMARIGRQFRVFVSSTFSDMHAEREVLQRRVFPRLQRFCQRRGAHFLAVDLRWGVSEEAGFDQRTMPLCLSEIRRCQEMTPRPNFLVLLGQRYGWQPLPYEIPAAEYDQLKPLITDANACALLEQWYRLDTNALPGGAYVLQPRTDTAFEDPEVWVAQVEQPLRRALSAAAEQLGWPEAQAREYVASATEQEIAEGALRADIDHALCFFRTITGLPEDDSAAQYVDEDPEAKARLEDLKRRLPEHLPGNVVEYETPWRGGVRRADLRGFADEVYRRLSEAIEVELAAAEVLDPLDQENEAHRGFGLDRQRGFFGREATLERVREYLRSPGGSPLVLHGPSGCGKSALMAKCADLVADALPDAVRLVRFIGATPQSTELRPLLTDLCAQLVREFGNHYEACKQRRLAEVVGNPEETERQRQAILEEYESSGEMRQLRRVFARSLEEIPADQPVVLLLDALDQLSPTDAAHSLNWLPTGLPEGVRLIVSVLEREDEAGACWRVARHRIAEDHLVPVPPLQPEEGAAILDEWLTQAGRTLTHEQCASVLTGFAQSGLPLYLRLAFEEARLWRSYDGVPCGADDRPGLGEDVPSVIRDLLWRLSRGAAHGEVLVRQALSYLGAARNGLADQEMLEILWRDEQVRENFGKRSPRSPATDSLPPIIWSRLHFDLAPYLVQRSADGTALLGFYHRQFAEVVAEECLSGERAKPTHRQLAEYFGEQPSWLCAEGAERRTNLRKVSELVTQQVGGECWDEVEGALTDLEFMEAKAEGGQVFDLAMDFTRCNRVLPQDRMWARNLRLLEQALRNDLHFIARHPTTLFQCFWNSAWWYDCPEAANHYDPPEHGWSAAGPPWERPEPKLCTLLERWREEKEARRSGFYWLRSLRPPPLALGGAQIACLRGHEDAVMSVACSLDGRWLASGSADGTVRAWDAVTGEEAVCLFGHQDIVECVAFPTDGQRLVSGSRDGTVRVWDWGSGSQLLLLRGREADERNVVSSRYGGTDVWSVAFAPFGPGLAAGLGNGSIQVWDGQTGEELRYLRGHEGWVCSLAFSPDGSRLASGSYGSSDLNHTVCLWDVATGEQVCSLGHRGAVQDLAFSPDGQQLALASEDDKVRIWDATDGTELACLCGHETDVRSVAFPSSGRLVVSGSGDETIRVWDWPAGRQVCCLRGHEHSVLSVACLPGEQQLVSGSIDGTVRVWDWRRGEPLPLLLGQDAPILHVAFSPDGRLLATGSLLGMVRLWDAANGEELACLCELENAVYNLAFSPDGRRLTSYHSGGAFRVWDVQTGVCLDVSDAGDWGTRAEEPTHPFRARMSEHPTVGTRAEEPTPPFRPRMSERSTVGTRAEEPTHPFRNSMSSRSTVVCAPDGQAIAWFPTLIGGLEGRVAAHPVAPIWAGRSQPHSYLALVTLEGRPAQASRLVDRKPLETCEVVTTTRYYLLAALFVLGGGAGLCAAMSHPWGCGVLGLVAMLLLIRSLPALRGQSVQGLCPQCGSPVLGIRGRVIPCRSCGQSSSAEACPNCSALLLLPRAPGSGTCPRCAQELRWNPQ